MDESRLKRLLGEYREKYSVPAVGAAVVTRSGELIVDVVGDRDPESGDPVQVGDEWHIGLCAKSLTAALYGRLVERGDTEWGVPIAEFFPDLADDLNAEWSETTIDEVLVCRSGMRADISRKEILAGWDDTRPVTDQRTSAVVTAMSRAPRGRGKFIYSNLSYIVVGAAIDRISGMPFEDAIRTHLFEPLGITSAGFGPPPDIWGHASRFRLGPITAFNGAPADPESLRSDNPPVMTSAGRLHISLSDWALLQLLFLNKGHGVLQPETIYRLLADPSAKDRGMAMGWAPAKSLDGMAYGMHGSNTFWSASALIDADFEHVAMVVANDGRSRVLGTSIHLAASLLRSD